MGAVSYFVRMVAKPGQAEAVKDLLLTNPRRIEQGEPGNLAFGVHRSTDNPNEFWLYETWVNEAAVQAHISPSAVTCTAPPLEVQGRSEGRWYRAYGAREDRPDGVRVR